MIKEVLMIPMIIYGIAMGLLMIIQLSKSRKEKEAENQVTISLLNSIMGEQLKNKKKFVIRIFLFRFGLLFGYTLISIWMLSSYPVIRWIVLGLIIIQLMEMVIRIYTIKKAETLKDVVNKTKISKVSPYIYLIGIAIVIGTML